ncbi:LysR family transcriptional regulator [Aquibium sp. ELW1220]|uniref:LysR family transcriptional regulator n=1 Tax=Aquibium sp. ELW1220 TaxID=2976766 RepID=UPI0025B1A2B1|nr:LysR family transcriptional regulator [Aquibium sp. ELW1220]MDN2580882.1 LysR family transcriptional regulator [Aquibium sp. ELW1220]
MDRLDAMRLLLSVSDKGSFSAASRELGVPLATVSRKINELETHLGAKLLIRTTRKVALTDTGAAYLASARRILEDVEEAERIAAGEFQAPRGELTLTAPVLFGRLHILPVVVDFLAAHPDINVRLVLSDSNLHLLDEHVDMAARIGRLPDSTMIATTIGAMRTVVCASPRLIEAYGRPARPEDAAALPSVNFEFLSPAANWPFRLAETGRVIDVDIAPRLSVSTAEAAVEAAVRGVGATRVLHYQCAGQVRDGALQIVLEAFEPEPAPVHLIHAARGMLPSKMRVFLDFAVPALRARLRAL